MISETYAELEVIFVQNWAPGGRRIRMQSLAAAGVRAARGR